MSRFSATGVTLDLSKACAALMFITACGNSASGGSDGTEAAAGTSAASLPGAGSLTSGGNSTGGVGVASSGDAQGGSSGTSGGNTTGGAGAANTGSASVANGGNPQGAGGATSGGNTTGGGSGASSSTIPECPGDWPENSVECRSSEECSDGLTCMFAVIPCGIRNAPVEGRCQTDEECGDQVCEFAAEYNCPPSVHLCQDACTEDSCAEGWTCAEDGRCEEIRCDEGYECPTGYGCVPEDTSYSHGCVPLSCTEGFECSNGRGCDPGGEGSNSHTGCRYLRCDEPGGTPCSLNFDCDPETATSPSGCVQRSCSNDSDCDCGFCNAGTCSTIGRCLLYQPQLCGCG